MRIGVLTGLAAEAWLLRDLLPDQDLELVVVRTGADPGRARREAERMAALGVTALLSFGLSGGLHAKLRAGDLVLADQVILPDGCCVATDRGWLGWTHERIRLSGTEVHVGAVAGAAELLATLADKQRLSAVSGALAVDMESGAAAMAAEVAGLPFFVVRAISDCAATALPSVARVPLRADGGISLPGIARALCLQPREWSAVARLAIDTRVSLGSLRRVVRAGALLPP